MVKSGVYVVWRPIDNTDPRYFVAKIGYTLNIKKRFSSANTFVYRHEDRIGLKNVWCVFHSPLYNKYGLHVLEKIIQTYYQPYRQPNSEFFIFPRHIDPGNDPDLMKYLSRFNIHDINVYTSIKNIPETIEQPI
jgi:hypothetical protein